MMTEANTTTPAQKLEKPKEPFFSIYNPQLRALIYQFLLLLAIVSVGYFIWINTARNLDEKHIRSGFHFLSEQAGFDIGEGLISFSPTDNYYHAILVGFLNTLRIAILGCFFATIIGTIVGVGRLSSNFLLRQLCSGYVEALRNIPPLVHLLAWYFLLTTILPDTESAINFGHDTYLSKSGLQFPHPEWAPAWGYLMVSMLIGAVVSFILYRYSLRKSIETGRDIKVWHYCLILTLVIPALIWQFTGAPLEATIPRMGVFGFVGGGALSPEFLAVFLGLTFYTSNYIAELVRSGIQAIAKGQSEAASALGLTGAQRMRLVILPQAMRIIVPPMTNQYLNLTKNSTLGVAIGYPELMNVLTTTQNQTGQALECISIVAIVFFVLSLITSLFMNWFNHRIGYKGR